MKQPRDGAVKRRKVTALKALQARTEHPGAEAIHELAAALESLSTLPPGIVRERLAFRAAALDLRITRWEEREAVGNLDRMLARGLGRAAREWINLLDRLGVDIGEVRLPTKRSMRRAVAKTAPEFGEDSEG